MDTLGWLYIDSEPEGEVPTTDQIMGGSFSGKYMYDRRLNRVRADALRCYPVRMWRRDLEIGDGFVVDYFEYDEEWMRISVVAKHSSGEILRIDQESLPEHLRSLEAILAKCIKPCGYPKYKPWYLERKIADVCLDAARDLVLQLKETLPNAAVDLSTAQEIAQYLTEKVHQDTPTDILETP